MRPVGAPERALGKFRDERAREGNRIFPGRGLPRNALRAAHLHPEARVAHEIEQAPEGRLLEAERGIHAPHVIDHHGHGGALQPRRKLFDERTLEMHLQVPAELRQAGAQIDCRFDSRALAQVLHEVEPHAAEPKRIKATELGVSHRRGNERDAAVVAFLRGDRIRDDPIVEAVAGGLDDHAVPDAEHGVQREEFLLGRIGRREGPALGERKNHLRSEHVHVRVAGSGRQFQFRPAG